MKKVRYLIVTLLFMTFGISSVKAYTAGEYVGQRNDYTLGIRTTSGGGAYYSSHSINGIFAVCLDPGADPGGKAMYVKRPLLSTKADKPYDAGLLTIITTDASSDTAKLSKIIASRIYTMLMGRERRITSGGIKYYDMYSYKDLVKYYNSWGSSWNSLVKAAKGSSFTKITTTAYSPTYKTSGGTNVTSSVMNGAKSLVKTALETAKQVRAGKSVADVTIPNGKSVTSKDKSGNIIKTVTRTITIEQFLSSNRSAILSVSCPSCAANGVTMKNYLNGSKTDMGSSEQLINKKYINMSTGDGKITLKTVFTASAKTCADIKYNVNVVAKESSISTEAYITEPSSYKYATQTFVYVAAKNQPKTFTNADTLSLCTGNCEELRDLCENNGNAEACDKFEKDFGSKCADCATKIENVECTPNPATIGLHEGIQVDDETCEYYNGDKSKNVKECILNKKDVAGNTYQAKTEGYPNNDYCKVYCTEDYDIDVPGAQTANSGRYIKLSAKVTGKKSCYTTPINTDKYNTDLEAARAELISAYNEWSHWYAGSIAGSPKGTTQNATACCGGGSYSYTNYTLEWNYGTYNTNGGYGVVGTSESAFGASNCTCHMSTCTSKPDKDGKTYNYSCCGSGSCSPRNGNPESIISRIRSNLSTATSRLNNAISSYNKIIKNYNSCSTTAKQDSKFSGASSSIWTMKYNFEPKVTFWYEDLYMEIAKNNKFDMYSSDKRLLTNGAGALSTLGIRTCAGEVNDRYDTCSTGWVYGNGATTTKSQFVCYKSGSKFACGNVAINTATSKYVSESQDATALFELPTQFYTAYPSGKLINEYKPGTSPLEKALPISLNTKAGVYNYTLMVDDLGEFYDTGKLGRIWGKDTNSKETTITTTLDDSSKCKSKGALNTSNEIGTDVSDGAYVCSYKVNCPDCTVECGPKGCEWTECKDGKCKIYCKNCIFTNGASNFNYRTVTTNDLNPTDRKLGANWSTPVEATGDSSANSATITTATEAKAYVTKNEIMANGEQIYDSESNEQVLTVELNQTMINDIKSYNKKYENDGGYGSDSLKCYDYKDEDGKTYENVYCYSTFLDQLMDSYSEKLKFKKNRIYSSDSDATRKKANNQCQGSKDCYWTTWTNAIKESKFKLSTSFGFSGNYGELGIGPSFR